METLAKILGSLFLGDNGEITPTKSQRIKDYLLIAFIVEHLLIAALLYWSDDEQQDETPQYIESVND